MDKTIAEKLGATLLGWIPSGWKTITGMTCLLALAILDETGVIDSAECERYWRWAVVLFGVGVTHKMTR